MNASHLLLMIGCLVPLDCPALDFWFVGSLPASHAAYTGEARFRLALIPVSANPPVARPESPGSLPLRVVNGRFAVKLKTPGGAAHDWMLKADFSEDGKTFAALPDQRVVLITLHLDKGVQGRLLGPTIVDPCTDKTVLAMIPGQNYQMCLQRRAAGSVSHSRSGWFSMDDGTALFDGKPSVFTAASLTIRENETKYWAMRAPVVPVSKGKSALGPEKVFAVPPALAMRQASADEYGIERPWTDAQGRKLMAALVGTDATTVIVRVPTGGLQLMPLNQLSQLDQDYVRQVAQP
ncbi:hypothetical protein [Prosthecobacter sp.]|uniref:hypothetical protein n=1 Tax=Prosthecobacter sp. TaxID=1965333 RepID=UPI002AB9B201|nr:hypothetical protein [Prosthecobacter sp.]MDZ4402589.1 hypothetical protein [Prosthecobacter sp.]